MSGPVTYNYEVCRERSPDGRRECIQDKNVEHSHPWVAARTASVSDTERLAKALHELWGPDAPWHPGYHFPCSPERHMEDARRLLAELSDAARQQGAEERALADRLAKALAQYNRFDPAVNEWREVRAATVPPEETT